MARPLRATIPHSLGKEEARRRLHDGFANLSQQATRGFFSLVSFDRRWEGDRLHFEGSTLGRKITGRLDVTADSILVEVDLPDLLVALAGRISDVVTKETQKLLGKK